jgi:Flp pilus assembly protein CpaB
VHLFDTLRRAARWHRRAIAALLVAVAVLAGLNTVSARTAGDVPVVIAQRSIAAGSRIAAADLAVDALPASIVPEGALTDIGQAVDRIAVVEVPVRQVLTPTALLGTEGRVGSGQVALPVTFGTAGTVGLLGVGSRIDVLGPNASGSGYGVVAAGVRVAAIPAVDDGGLLPNGSSRLVLLEVSSAQAAEIVASMSVSALSFAMH